MHRSTRRLIGASHPEVKKQEETKPQHVTALVRRRTLITFYVCLLPLINYGHFLCFFMSMQHRRNKKCIKIFYQPGRDLPLIPKRLLYKRGLWQNHGLFHWAHASLHISAASWLAGNISGEDVKNRSPTPPHFPLQPPPPTPNPQALLTSRDCWHVHSESRMWQSPLR